MLKIRPGIVVEVCDSNAVVKLSGRRSDVERAVRALYTNNIDKIQCRRVSIDLPWFELAP